MSCVFVYINHAQKHNHRYINVVFCKRATNYTALFRKMTYKHEASYGSSLPCIVIIVVTQLTNSHCNSLNDRSLLRKSPIPIVTHCNESLSVIKIKASVQTYPSSFPMCFGVYYDTFLYYFFSTKYRAFQLSLCIRNRSVSACILC